LARADLPAAGQPSAALSAEVSESWKHACDRTHARMAGLDLAADRVVLDAFKGDLVHLKALCKEMSAVSAVKYAVVANNFTIVEEAEKLVRLLGGDGCLRPAAAGQAEVLRKKVPRLLESYQRVDELDTWYRDTISHAYFLPEWLPPIKGIPAFVSGRDKFAQGPLSEEINALWAALERVDSLVQRRELGDATRAAYLASGEGQFLNHWLTHGRNAAIVELTRLVAAGTASMGDIKRCYVASDDRYEYGAFSVEVSVSIAGRHGVVVHAHCKPDGTPKDANGCHFKLANNKRDGGNTCMLNGPLRAALLPTAGDIMADREAVWEGPRPDWL
jgi:hypothetical protein